MPGWFVTAIVFFILAVVVYACRVFVIPTKETQRGRATRLSAYPESTEPEPYYTEAQKQTRFGIAVGAVVVALLAVGFMFAASYNPVGTKNEGIVTSFGATAGHLSNGFHLTWPWQKVHQMDAAVQTDNHTGGNCTTAATTDPNSGEAVGETACQPAKGGGCINARIANQQTGCADVTIQWRIKTDKKVPETLYKDYRSFEHVRDALVTRQLTRSVNEALATYNPLDAIVTGSEAKKGKTQKVETLVSLSERIKGKLVAAVGDRIEVVSVLMPIVKFDTDTQARINQLQQQVALTRIAGQAQQTAIKQATANNSLAKSVNNSPNVLVARCLDLLDVMVKAGQPVPAGFSCWPGGSGVGVLVQGNTPKATATP